MALLVALSRYTLTSSEYNATLKVTFVKLAVFIILKLHLVQSAHCTVIYYSKL